ncbi:MAG: hypothetical protein KGJ90_07010, partial [Patescibacteria group bacterium]|nr:hypothetical protein [Patescibacteria group bacterium]
MKRILLILAFIAGPSLAVNLNTLTNTNASHELPTGGNAFNVADYQHLQAVTNMWCGDLAYERDNQQEWIYQCPSANMTPGFGSGSWAPFFISSGFLAT